jgi:hypothetical protein
LVTDPESALVIAWNFRQIIGLKPRLCGAFGYVKLKVAKILPPRADVEKAEIYKNNHSVW